MPFDCDIGGVAVGSFVGSALAVIGYGVWCWGYVRGYTAGLAYGEKGMKELHEHHMEGLRSLYDHHS